jgi:hypothetical protein
MKKLKEKQIEVVATNIERKLPWGLVESEPVYKKPDHPRTEADYLSTLLEAVTQEDWGEVIKNTVKKAKQGDAVALNWLAQYLMGKPDVRVPTPIVSIIEPVK